MPDNVNINLDAQQLAFFNRQVGLFDPQLAEVIRTPLKMMQLVPEGTIKSRGAPTYTYGMMQVIGKAKVIANWGDDLPRVDLQIKEYTKNIHNVGCSYGYNVQEIDTAIEAGVDLDPMKAIAAEEAMQLLDDRIVAYGAQYAGLDGLLTIDNVPTGTVAATGTGSSTLFTNKTAQNIIADIALCLTEPNTLTGGAETPNTLLFDTTIMNYLKTQNAGFGNDTTILEFIQRQFPEVTFESAHALEPTERAKFMSPDPFTGRIMIAYTASANKVRWEKPMDNEALAPQARGLEFITPNRARVLGVICTHPLSINIKEGI